MRRIVNVTLVLAALIIGGGASLARGDDAGGGADGAKGVSAAVTVLAGALSSGDEGKLRDLVYADTGNEKFADVVVKGAFVEMRLRKAATTKFGDSAKDLLGPGSWEEQVLALSASGVDGGQIAIKDDVAKVLLGKPASGPADDDDPDGATSLSLRRVNGVWKLDAGLLLNLPDDPDEKADDLEYFTKVNEAWGALADEIEKGTVTTVEQAEDEVRKKIGEK